MKGAAAREIEYATCFVPFLSLSTKKDVQTNSIKKKILNLFY